MRSGYPTHTDITSNANQEILRLSVFSATLLTVSGSLFSSDHITLAKSNPGSINIHMQPISDLVLHFQIFTTQ